MIFSQKAVITVVALITAVLTSTCSEQPAPLLSPKQQHVLGSLFTLVGPCMLVCSTKNLFTAKRLEELVTQPAITHAIQKEATSLRKRGLRGIIAGTVLSFPLIAGIYLTYQARDQINQITMKQITQDR